MLTLTLAFITAFTVTHLALRPTIRIALNKHLCDEPSDRRSHKVRTPSLGGVPIFAGLFFSLVLWTPFSQFGNLQFILCAFIILFLIGIKDDIEDMQANRKFLAQLLAVVIVVLNSDVRLTGFYGFFGWEATMPYWLSVAFSMFTILVIINGVNLIDGINGLAGGITILVAGTLGIWFLLIDHLEFATLAMATVGATVAFLRYNITPARIFMGDTGSLILGMVLAILTVEFIALNAELPSTHHWHLEGIPAVAIGVMFLPLFDTFRVFITRIYRGVSPFKPDRRHIHHLLIDYGYSHMRATGILLLINTGFILLVFNLHDRVEQHLLLLGILMLALGMTFALQRANRKQKSKMSARNAEPRQKRAIHVFDIEKISNT
jgi:UDP-N-acetylmuramyl pentapeptide phosphotransferase/UDP-N-acetylglucosamine-1-phosphate transferase